jgi:hypothetical protein
MQHTRKAFEHVEGIAPVIKADLMNHRHLACVGQLLGRQRIVLVPIREESVEPFTVGNTDASPDGKGLFVR